VGACVPAMGGLRVRAPRSSGESVGMGALIRDVNTVLCIADCSACF